MRTRVASRPAHRVVEELDLARGAVRLGEVHRGVGLAEQRLGAGDLVGDARDADAHRDVEHIRLEAERLVEHGADPLGDPVERAGVADVLAEDHELVATEAGQRVGRAHHGRAAGS